jgi:Na+-translocating ferredoxin:NAD+ oxidoreductase subunit B
LESKLNSEKLYINLREHLDKYPIGFPASKSGADIRILKHLFDPEEALIATYLTDKFEPLDKIYEKSKTKMSVSELKERLDIMVSKGAIHYRNVDGEKHYANAYLVIGMYEYQLKRLTPEFLEDISEYAGKEFGIELFGTKISQFRTVPVETSISPEYGLPSYEELENIISNSNGPFALMECICRKAHKMGGETCKVTSRLETCFGMGEMAEMYVSEGWGRQVSREEALETLRKNQEEGLVFQAENIKDPKFICSCCGCCCGILTNLKEFPKPIDFFSTNYFAEIDEDSCVGCGICLEKCQIEAIKMKNDISKVNKRRCIGCGNCVASCPEEAIQLIKKLDVYIPPENEDELFTKILDKKKEIKSN